MGNPNGALIAKSMPLFADEYSLAKITRYPVRPPGKAFASQQGICLAGIGHQHEQGSVWTPGNALPTDGGTFLISPFRLSLCAGAGCIG